MTKSIFTTYILILHDIDVWDCRILYFIEISYCSCISQVSFFGIISDTFVPRFYDHVLYILVLRWWVTLPLHIIVEASVHFHDTLTRKRPLTMTCQSHQRPKVTSYPETSCTNFCWCSLVIKLKLWCTVFNLRVVNRFLYWIQMINSK